MLRAWIDRILIVVGTVSLFILPRNVGGDGGSRFDALSNLLRNGKLDSNRFSLIGPLFSAPLWFLGNALGQDPASGVIAYNAVIFVIGLYLFYRLLAPELGAAIVRKFILLLLCASMFPNHIKHYYGEVFTALTFAIGALAVSLEKKTWLGWTALVLGSANIPASIPGFGLATLKLVWEKRRLRYLAFVAAAAALVMVEAWSRRGSPFVSGYEGDHGNATIMPYSGKPGFSYPFFLGLFSIFFSFGKGLIFFVPGLFLPVRRFLSGESRVRVAYQTWILFLCGLILVYSRWWSWYGGGFWGPRYFLIACIPASLAMALASERGRSQSGRFIVASLAVITLSFWVGVTGSVFLRTNLEMCEANNYSLEYLCWDVPEFSALVRPFIALKTLNARDYFFFVYYGVVYLWISAPLWTRFASLCRERGSAFLSAVRIRDWRV